MDPTTSLLVLKGVAMATKLQLAYISGFFDGDGCISGRSEKGHRRANISIHQKRPEILHWIQKSLGMGHLYHNFTSDLWSWRIAGKKDIEKFIDLILPYSIVKKRELEIGRELNNLATLIIINKDTNSSERERLYNELRRLKSYD